ncbi:MAG: hypothetical protein J6W51_11200 [Fibrobacter sp.]|nr:hypothetical protein [Fibrobacter sp.]
MTEEEEEDTALLLLVVALLQLVMPDGACPELVERVPASPFLEEELCVSLDPSLELRMTKK